MTPRRPKVPAKVLLLARDTTIRDPTILGQLRSSSKAAREARLKNPEADDRVNPCVFVPAAKNPRSGGDEEGVKSPRLEANCPSLR